MTASAFALVEQEFDELESVFARREAQLHIAKPSVDDSRGGRLNIRAEAIRDTVEDAEADGVQFVVRAGIPQAHAAIS